MRGDFHVPVLTYGVSLLDLHLYIGLDSRMRRSESHTIIWNHGSAAWIIRFQIVQKLQTACILKPDTRQTHTIHYTTNDPVTRINPEEPMPSQTASRP